MTAPFPIPSSSDTSRSSLAIYDLGLDHGPAQSARRVLLNALRQAPEPAWLECGRALVLRGDLDTALEVFSQAANFHPASGDVCIGLAGLYWQLQRHAEAESLLRDWLSRHSADARASFLLARLLFDEGRARAAAQATRTLFEDGPQDVDTVIQAVEMLDDFGCPQDAMHICEDALTGDVQDPRLHAYAGMLGIQLGQFPEVRAHYQFALDHAPEAVEWNIPIGLSALQCYRDSTHPDFSFFHKVLAQPGLSERARTTTLFAIGKACDDIGDYARAARYFREGNARAKAHSSWSRKQWKRLIEARLSATPFPWKFRAPTDWTPIFIVGVPRSGTTLLAELIARHPQVCNRGELGWLQGLAKHLASLPSHRNEKFVQAAAVYASHLRQDDSNADWFIDKQPLNLLHIDLILAMWPSARIIHCQRSARDVALSLWSQTFYDSAHDYAYDFSDIAAVIRGCDRLMTQWRTRYATSIYTVRYEELAQRPDACIAEVSRWIGLPESGLSQSVDAEAHAIRTASAWQARQPVHAKSIKHWKNYASCVPELRKFQDA